MRGSPNVTDEPRHQTTASTILTGFDLDTHADGPDTVGASPSAQQQPLEGRCRE